MRVSSVRSVKRTSNLHVVNNHKSTISNKSNLYQHHGNFSASRKTTLTLNKLQNNKSFSNWTPKRSFVTQISSAVIYKLGCGLITQNLRLPKNSDTIETKSPSSAITGTIWVTPPPEILFLCLAIQGHRQQEEPCTTVTQLLKANVNNVIEVQVDGRDWIIGRIDSLQIDESNPSVGLLFLESERATMGIPLQRVANVRMPFHPPPDLVENTEDQSLKTTYIKDHREDKLLIRFKRSKPSETEEVAKFNYLTNSLTWQPMYRLEVDPTAKKAQLTMNAFIMNGVDDLYIEDLVCVAGVPVSRFLTTIDPLVNKQPVSALLGNLQQKFDELGGQTLLAKRSVSESAASSTRADVKEEDDFYLYKFKQVSIAKNDKLVLPIYRGEVSYRDVYTCHVPLYLEEGTVYHSIEINNTTGLACASGPVMITKDNLFYGQDNLKYIAPGSTSRIQMSETNNVSVVCKQTVAAVTEEVRRADRLESGHKALTCSATLVVTNKSPEQASVFLSRDFVGIPRDNGTGEVITHPNFSNPRNTIRWTVELNPGESKELTHVYSQYSTR